MSVSFTALASTVRQRNRRVRQIVPATPGLPLIPTTLGVFSVRDLTGPLCAFNHVSTCSQTGLTPGIVRASSATGAQPATL